MAFRFPLRRLTPHVVHGPHGCRPAPPLYRDCVSLSLPLSGSVHMGTNAALVRGGVLQRRPAVGEERRGDWAELHPTANGVPRRRRGVHSPQSGRDPNCTRCVVCLCVHRVGDVKGHQQGVGPATSQWRRQVSLCACGPWAVTEPPPSTSCTTCSREVIVSRCNLHMTISEAARWCPTRRPAVLASSRCGVFPDRTLSHRLPPVRWQRMRAPTHTLYSSPTHGHCHAA